jgi:hypothetical protein
VTFSGADFCHSRQTWHTHSASKLRYLIAPGAHGVVEKPARGWRFACFYRLRKRVANGDSNHSVTCIGYRAGNGRNGQLMRPKFGALDSMA